MGAVAQLGERCVRNAEVEGSNPFGSNLRLIAGCISFVETPSAITTGHVHSMGMARLIAIEGIDGSGKGTLAALLRDQLASQGQRVSLISFPRYEQTFFGQRIGEFLNGKFGQLDEIHPFLVSLLYAGDRRESRAGLLKALEDNDVVILDRYVASNLAHQCAKLPEAEQSELREWIEQVEFGLHQLPRPDITLLLDLTVNSAQLLIQRKSRRSYTAKTADLQEADAAYLEKVRAVYLGLAAGEPGWRRIPVEVGENLRNPQEILAEAVAALRL
jgi:dTMP kinase